MSQRLQAVRGMNDLLPDTLRHWHWVERELRALTKLYGYEEIRLPLLEQTELFSRSIGDVTDVVEKEMYTFLDRNGDSLTLRPEGTAGCVRAGIEHGLFHNQTQKLWYLGPMFRHERPQKGRYRQFYHFGLEAFGYDSPEVDAEMILFAARLWQRLGLTSSVQLQLNSLATPLIRQQYKTRLIAYLKQYEKELDEENRRRLLTNPLRVLDSKQEGLASIIEGAPILFDELDESCRNHFQRVCECLDKAGVPYVLNPFLVRGLDYYTKTVFEWVTCDLGAQGTVCAGGRFDGLVEQLGGQSTPAVGFAIGLERLMILLETHGLTEKKKRGPDIYIITVDEKTLLSGFLWAERLRTEFPALRVELHTEGGSLKSQFKRAHKKEARFAMILGEEEWKNQQVSFKWLQEEKPQQLWSEKVFLEMLPTLIESNEE